MKLTQQALPDLFSIVDSGQLDKSCPFDFVDNRSRALVVTAGDSWTWGMDMTVNNDRQYRLDNAYGRILSRELSADWLCLGQCGSGNSWLSQRIREFGAIVPELDYQKIYLFCTYTEFGRALNAEIEFDFVEFFKSHRPGELAHAVDTEITNRIVAATQDARITLRIGRNFVDHPGPNPKVLPTPWYQLLGIEPGRDCITMSHWAIDAVRSLLADGLVPRHYHEEFVNYCIDLADRAVVRTRSVEKLPLIRKYHPNAEGHRRWANYLLQNL